MDIISINRLEVLTLIGVHPHEQVLKQKLLITLQFACQAAHSAQSDELQHTQDYAQIAEHIQAFAQSQHYQLLESFGEQLAQSLQQHYALQGLTLTIEKPAALKAAQSVSLTLTRGEYVRPASS